MPAFPVCTQKLGLLNLGYSKVCVTDAALHKLSGLTKLQSLNIGSMQLYHKSVTDASLQLISSSFRQLTQLGLMSLDVSDEGVKQLASLSNLQVCVCVLLEQPGTPGEGGGARAD